jgi:maltose O-acetyltransferase
MNGCRRQKVRLISAAMFASGVEIVSKNHDPKNQIASAESLPMLISCRCWIGANAVILSGVQLGDDVIIGASAVQTKSFPGRSVISEGPAKLISAQPSKD